MTTKTTRFDVTKYLDTDEAISDYISEALETNDPAFIADALGVVARARGMTQIARDTGLSRESLYKALASDGNPSLVTVVRVLTALGMNLRAEPAARPVDSEPGPAAATHAGALSGDARTAPARKQSKSMKNLKAAKMR